jgi:Integral peroxisomal membrane peroxin
VQPPLGWIWSEKKWALDLWSREWVEERIITGVEVETEGERWVYDLNYEYGDGTGGAYESGVNPIIETPTSKGKGIKMRNMPSWEEGGVGDEGFDEADGRRGDWRRRRWVRMVKRKWQPGHTPSARTST